MVRQSFCTGDSKCIARPAGFGQSSRWMLILGMLALLLLQVACASGKGMRRNKPHFNQRERLRRERATLRGQMVVYGKASYYGAAFHGRKTASGETFDMNALTAAHRQWPFGTLCRVTNLHNGKSVVVRINDRGPFIAGRVMDLSYGAARALEALKVGVIDVKIEVLNWGEASQR